MNGSLALRACRSISFSILAVALVVPVQAADPPRADATGPDRLGAAWPRFGGVYPHLAAVADSYSECGIGAVVPWADRLWTMSYVSHIRGSGVGLYEIDTDLSIRRRPESVVGTHAGRMVHRESGRLIIGPYVIDSEGNVDVIEGLTGQRVTAVMRHLTDPAEKVYVQAMEGNFYEVDLGTLEVKRLFDLNRELEIEGRAHFKGAYTAQGRVVVANNTYHQRDQTFGSGGGRLAEWDGHRWNVLKRTAFCDVTSAGGIHGASDDDATLWAVGWDRASILLAVLDRGQWFFYRLPKGSQSYDQAWCTEWPRIREVAQRELMLDMHGLFYRMSPELRPGNLGGLDPLAFHLRMTPDFCRWQNRLVLAGNEVSSLGHRHRTGGQPQSNLWFGSLDELTRWGAPGGWGGPWFEYEVSAGVPSDPFLIRGFKNRTLHLFEGGSAPIISRCTDRFEVLDLPERLASLPYITIDRGSMTSPAPGYAFEVNRGVVVYLAVHDRGQPRLPKGWEKTGTTLTWRHQTQYSDTLYRRSFPAGTVEIPEHNGHNELMHYGVPHLCFLDRASAGGESLVISKMPSALNAKASRPARVRPASGARFTVEIDHEGTGRWMPLETIRMPAGGYASRVLPDDTAGSWLRLTADRDLTVTAQFCFDPDFRSRTPQPAADLFRPLPRATEPASRIHAAMLPFADRLWIVSHVRDASGQATPGGLFELDADMRFAKRPESIPGIFANRKMIDNVLCIGPHVITESGNVRTFASLAGRHVVDSMRHPVPGKIYFLTAEGRLLEGDLESLAVVEVADLPEELNLPDAKLRFGGGHLAGNKLLVAAHAPDTPTGCLAEYDGSRWTVIDRAAFAEISNLGSMSETVVATGWDRASALLKVRVPGREWTTCRLPKAAAAYDTAWRGERPRIREVQTERMLLDAHGLCYEVSGLPYAWSIRPIAAHGRLISDFTSWRGMLVLAGADTQARTGGNYVAGSPACGLWFGKTDDLWQFDMPAGRGGPWLETPVLADAPSDPYLMTCFERKRVEFRHDADQSVSFTLEVDPTVQREHWQPYKTIVVPPGESATHEFPDGYAAHWVRVRVDRNCTATAQFVYNEND